MNTPLPVFVGDHAYRVHREKNGRFSVETSLFHATRGTQQDRARPWTTSFTRFSTPQDAHQYATELLSWATQRWDTLTAEHARLGDLIDGDDHA